MDQISLPVNEMMGMMRRFEMAQDVAEVLTLDEIKAILGEHLPDLRRRYHVKSLGVFGSYVRGEQRAGSDVDLLVEFTDPQLTLLDFVDSSDRLSDLLGVSVDLVERETLKPSLAKHILGEVTPL